MTENMTDDTAYPCRGLKKGGTMKYLLLAYTKQADWDAVDVTSPEFQAMCAFYENLSKELTSSGELIATEGLAHPALTKVVRRQDGSPVASDGPYAEFKEVLASFAIVDCDSLDRAIAIAARVVDAVADTRDSADHARRRGGYAGGQLETGEGASRCGGPVARTGAAGPRRAGAPIRSVRHRRGRGAGGTAGSGRAVARTGDP
jgi:hypothetical protein